MSGNSDQATDLHHVGIGASEILDYGPRDELLDYGP